MAIAEQLHVEIISADSRQIIKYLNIGTAKPRQDECNKVCFHFVNIIEPGERYNAFRFADEANIALKQITSGGKLPLVVGGTGLYLKALTDKTKKETAVSSLVESLSGVISLSDAELKKEYTDFLSEKYK